MNHSIEQPPLNTGDIIVKIKVVGKKQSDTKKIALPDLAWVEFDRADCYCPLEAEDNNFHDLQDNELIELTLNDTIKLSLSVASFLSLIPKTVKEGVLNFADCILHLNDISSQANIITIHSVRFIKTTFNTKDHQPPPLLSVVTALEQQFIKQTGLYHCAKLNRGLVPVKKPLLSLPTDRPILLLIHGTASNTEYTFRDLWQSVESHLWQDLLEDEYDAEHVYGYEHHTLSKSPLENALDLVKQLPKGARLHLLTHSRGGLIGELLTRGQLLNNAAPFTDEEVALFGDQRAVAEELRSELIDKKIKIERFVRIACPVRGTTFANQRLDIYFSIFLNTIGMIPALKNAPFYQFVNNLLHVLAISKSNKKGQIEHLPGLACMLPESTLIRVLNGSSVCSEADLSIIAGDIEGAGAFKILEILTTHFFYLEQHDLIVNTSSMTGGVKRKSGAYHFFHQGPQVSHFHYFSNPVSVQHLVQGLAWKSGDGPEDFKPLEKPISHQRGRLKQPVFDAEKATVFLIPGLFGSHLKQGNERIWLDWDALVQGDLHKLGYSSQLENTRADDGLVMEKYEKLCRFLSEHYNVIAFPYDWRLSLRLTAKKLVKKLNKHMQETQDYARPVHLIAHSTGGIIARLVSAYDPELWEKMVERSSRLLMLGTPQHGSLVIPRILMGQDRLTKLLTLLQYKKPQKPRDEADIITLFRQFPGLLELMPTRAAVDFFDVKSWQKLKEKGAENTAVPDSKQLADARNILVKDMANAAIDESLFLVLGFSPETPERYIPTENGEGVGSFSTTLKGDGFSTWKASTLPYIKTWYMDASHGEMANDESAFPALRQILETGTTTQLQEKPEELERSIVQQHLPLARGIVFPDRRELLNTAMSVAVQVNENDEAFTKLAVQVTHGDLSHALYPVLTGHYDGEGIQGAEAGLDAMLDCNLSNSFELGLYPGPIRTSDVFLHEGKTLKGAIIIGLGRVGTLSANTLKNSITHGLLDYVRTLRERKIRHNGSLGISFLLLASNAGGVPVSDVLLAILRGVYAANTALESDLYGKVRFTSLELVEKYLDKAAQAAYALKDLAEANEFKKSIVLRQFINSGQDGKERITKNTRKSRWQNVQIIKSAEGGLYFTQLTQRARIEANLVPTQRKLIDRFISSSINTTTMNSGLCTTLFELIVPLELKSRIQNVDVQLVLDEDTARYPWELLQARSLLKGKAEKPFVVQSGLVRQLIQEDYRRQPSLSVHDSVLVVGDPALGEQRRLFPSLAGAKREAKAVALQLDKQGYKTTLMLNKKADEIVQALYEKPYRIIHLAGHGVYKVDSDGKKIDSSTTAEESYTGMVLGDGIYLSAKEIAQMSSVPDIVFINCCHTGFIERQSQPNKLAANLASQLIKNGVTCVIAAGWAVDDDGAELFAEQFYLEMLQHNKTFGHAVKLARQRVYENNPQSNTWGAYQCYGPHDFRMQYTMKTTNKKSFTSIRSANDFTLPKELTLALNARAKELQHYHAPAEITTLRQELLGLTRSLPPVWRKDGLLLSTIGNLYGVLGEVNDNNRADEHSDFKVANDYYKKAFNAEISNFPFDTLERYAAIKMCRARCLKNQKPSNPRWKEVYDRAILKLINITDMAPSSQRYILLGDAYKHLLMLLDDDAKSKLDVINNMQNAYDKARELTEVQTGLLEPTAAFNYLLATAAKSMLLAVDADKTVYKHWINQLSSILTQAQTEDKTLHTAIQVLDNTLVQIFLGLQFDEGKLLNIGATVAKVSLLEDQYKDLMDEFEPDETERAEVLTTIRFLYVMGKKMTSSEKRGVRDSLLLLKESCRL